MILGFKTQLRLNNRQRTALAQHAGIARHSWNWALGLTKQILDHNKTCATEDKIKFPTAIDLHKWLVALVKPENPWYYSSSKCSPQYALRHLREAWSRCFNKTAGAPRFKKKGRDDSFTLDGTIKVVDHNKIQVPVIGVLKTYEQLPFGYKPKSVTISRTADRWFISFKVEVEPQPTNTTEKVACDLGLLRFATLSTGEEIQSPRPFKHLERKLVKLQWRNRNKELHSKNWRKAQVKIARLHAQIANVRKDFIHKLTSRLAKNHSEIVIEDLNVSGMIAFGHLAKAVLDSGFFEFRRQLDYKCQLYGSKLVLAGRFFPSSKLCFGCGDLKESMPLAVRTYECECSWRCDRDFNASLNLLRLVQPEVKLVEQKSPKTCVEARS